MKRPALFFSAVLCLASLRAQARPAAVPSEIHYRFDVSARDVIHVTMELPVAAGGTEVLTLPSTWAGETELFRAIRTLRVLGAEQTLRATDSPARWLLESQAAGTARLAYDLVQDRSGPLRPPMEHRVILSPELWVFNGDDALVLPLHRGDGAVHATFDFTGVDEPAAEGARGGTGDAPRRAVLTSFGETAHQEYRGTWSGVANAMFAGGDLHLRRFAVDGEPVVLAATPAMDDRADEIAPRLRDLLQAEQRLFGDRDPAKRYTMLLAGYDGVHEGGAGSAFTDAAALFLAPGQPVSDETLALVAHETLHRWLPQGLGSVADTQEIAWFAEGFPRFYESVMLVRAGLLSEAGYLRRVNTLVRSYRTSPRIGATNAELQRLPAADHFRFEEPYHRGAMVALWLDSTIAAESGGRAGLADLLHALRKERNQPLTAERIFRTASRFIGAPSVAHMRRDVIDGAEVPLLPGSLGACVVFAETPAWTFSLGFDVASLEPNGRVRGVEQGSNAYAAGLRDGQLLGGWSVWTGDAQREVTLDVQDAGGSRSRVSFLPRGERIAVPQAARIPGCDAGLRLPR